MLTCVGSASVFVRLSLPQCAGERGAAGLAVVQVALKEFHLSEVNVQPGAELLHRPDDERRTPGAHPPIIQRSAPPAGRTPTHAITRCVVVNHLTTTVRAPLTILPALLPLQVSRHLPGCVSHTRHCGLVVVHRHAPLRLTLVPDRFAFSV